MEYTRRELLAGAAALGGARIAGGTDLYPDKAEQEVDMVENAPISVTTNTSTAMSKTRKTRIIPT